MMQIGRFSVYGAGTKRSLLWCCVKQVRSGEGGVSGWGWGAGINEKLRVRVCMSGANGGIMPPGVVLTISSILESGGGITMGAHLTLRVWRLVVICSWVAGLSDVYSRKLDVINRGFSGYNSR
jgi:hypothetical protein